MDGRVAAELLRLPLTVFNRVIMLPFAYLGWYLLIEFLPEGNNLQVFSFCICVMDRLMNTGLRIRDACPLQLGRIFFKQKRGSFVILFFLLLSLFYSPH
jgi:hypothetical protein